MSKIKVGINGFGRIGRLVFRAAMTRDDIEIVGINDLIDVDYMVYMLKYDTMHGRFNGTVEAKDGKLVVNGHAIRVTAERNPEDLKWNEVGAEYVVESTGLFLTKEKAEAHLKAGAKRVVMSAPSKDDTPMFVMGVNHKTYAGQTIVSNASCTTNCLAPLAKVIHDKFGIVEGLMTTIHGYTGDQMVLDGPHRKGDLRRARAAAVNIVPNSTGAAKAIGLVIPELNGKLIGSAQRVPVPTGSTTILTAVVKGKDITVEGINAAMKSASNQSFGYTEELLVSSDIVGIRYGSLFDATQTMVAQIAEDLYQVQVVSWYDNENSYTSQMVRTIKYFAELG